MNDGICKIDAFNCEDDCKKCSYYEEFKYTIKDIFKFKPGTKLQDKEGNIYKIFKDEEHQSKTLKYAIVTEKLINSKFKIVEIVQQVR